MPQFLPVIGATAGSIAVGTTLVTVVTLSQVIIAGAAIGRAVATKPATIRRTARRSDVTSEKP